MTVLAAKPATNPEHAPLRALLRARGVSPFFLLSEEKRANPSTKGSNPLLHNFGEAEIVQKGSKRWFGEP